MIDAYARRILGWRASTSMTADLVLDAVEQAIWTRQHEDRADFTSLVAHHDRGVQYVSVAHTQRLADAGIRPSVGAVGSSADNALAESINGLYKTEVIRRQGPWHTVDAVEIATAEWVDWYTDASTSTPATCHPRCSNRSTTLNNNPKPQAEGCQTIKSPDLPGRFLAWGG